MKPYVGQLRTCPLCGGEYRLRWINNMRCTPCHNKYQREYKATVIGTLPCKRCGKPINVTVGRSFQLEYGETRCEYHATCYRDATRKWRDAKEVAREKQRRVRASRRARGLNAVGKPYKKPNCFKPERVVPPTNRAPGVAI